MIYWPESISPDASVSLVDEAKLVTSFENLFKKYPNNTLFGPDPRGDQDTAQSQYLGDCYFITAIIAFQKKSNSFRNLFVI